MSDVFILLFIVPQILFCIFCGVLRYFVIYLLVLIF